MGYGRRMPDGSRALIPFVDARGMAAATGLTSTVEDMAKFVSAQFRKGSRGGGRILGRASLREMHRVRTLESDLTRGQGIGFDVSRVNNKVYVGHGGGYPGHTTLTSIQLDSRVGVVVLTNTNDSNPGQIAQQLRNTVGDAVAKATAVEASVVAWDPAWERFAGLYRSRGSETQVVLLNQRLVIISPSGRSVDNPLRLDPIGDGNVSDGHSNRRWRCRRNRSFRRGERRGRADDQGRLVHRPRQRLMRTTSVVPRCVIG